MSDKPHEVGLDHRGEFDEVFVSNASVHIERMDVTAFWIGIEPPEESGLPMLHIRTGVERGIWYFNVEQDSLDALPYYSIQRPRSPRLGQNWPKKSRKPTPIGAEGGT